MKRLFATLPALLTAAGLLASPAMAQQTAPAAAAETRPLTREALAQGLYELVYSPRLDAVFVAAAGGRGEGAQPPRILRLDPKTLAVQAEIALPAKGAGLALDDAAGRLYVGQMMDAAITVVDVDAGKVLDSIRLAEKVKDAEGKEDYPHHFREMVVDPATHRLFAPGLSFDDSALYVVDTQKGVVETVLPGFGFVAAGVALDEPGKRLFVTNVQGQLIFVDTGTLQITGKVETAGDQLLNIAYDAKGQRLFVTDQGHEAFAEFWGKHLPDYKPRGAGNQVLVLDARDGSQIALLPTGEGPIAPLFDAALERLYVTNRAAGTISVFDTKTYALIETVPAATHPNSLAFDGKANALFATIKNGEADPKTADESVLRIGF